MVTTRNSRQDVVAAAGRMFAEKGYHGTSMRDIGRAVGLLGSSLYSHIESKEDLLVEVVDEGARLFLDSAESALNMEANAEVRLRRLVEGHIGVVLDHLDVVRTYLNEARMLDSHHRAGVLQARDAYEAAFRQILRQGVDEGQFAPDLDPKIASIFILSILNAVERWYHAGGDLGRDDLSGAIWGFISSGLR